MVEAWFFTVVGVGVGCGRSLAVVAGDLDFLTVGRAGVMCRHDAMLGVWLSSHTGLLLSRLHLCLNPQRTNRIGTDPQVSLKYLEQSLLREHPSATLVG